MLVRCTRYVSIGRAIVLALIWSVQASGQAQGAALPQTSAVTAGKPAASFVGLTPIDYVYAKTSEGWRFTTRTFIASATATEAK
jgi:hypothetical protein